MTLSSLTPVKRSALVTTFIGLHIPLVVLAVYGMFSGLPGLLPVLLVTLVATLVAVVGTLYALLRILDLDVATSGTSGGILTNA